MDEDFARSTLDRLDEFRLDAQFGGQSTVQKVRALHGNRRERQIWRRARLLGRGRFGRVWQERREDENGDWHYRAVKVCALSALDVTEIDYRRELAALAAFSSSKYSGYFVHFHGWWIDPTNLYIAMEYFSLGDLSHHVPTGLEEYEAKEVAKDVIEGLRAMHDVGFIHRDIKPQNVLVVQKRPQSRQWRVKIGDFGISKRVLDETKTELHTSVGTRPFCAPEILGYLRTHQQTSTYSSKVDIWSFGCLLFFVASGGKVPFADQANLVRYCDRTVKFNSDGTPLRFGAAGLSLIESLLRPEPDDRPSAFETSRHHWFHTATEPGAPQDSQIEPTEIVQTPPNYNSFLDSASSVKDNGAARVEGPGNSVKLTPLGTPALFNIFSSESWAALAYPKNSSNPNQLPSCPVQPNTQTRVQVSPKPNIDKRTPCIELDAVSSEFPDPRSASPVAESVEASGVVNPARRRGINRFKSILNEFIVHNETKTEAPQQNFGHGSKSEKEAAGRWMRFKLPAYDGYRTVQLAHSPLYFGGESRNSSPDKNEFTHSRVSIVDVCTRGFEYRPSLFLNPRRTSIVIQILLGQQDALELGSTLQSAFENVAFMNETWHPRAWEKTIVVVGHAAKGPLHPSSKALLGALGLYRDDFDVPELSEARGADSFADALVFENTVRTGLRVNGKTGELKLYDTCCQMIYISQLYDNGSQSPPNWVVDLLTLRLRHQVLIPLELGETYGRDFVAMSYLSPRKNGPSFDRAAQEFASVQRRREHLKYLPQRTDFEISVPKDKFEQQILYELHLDRLRSFGIRVVSEYSILPGRSGHWACPEEFQTFDQVQDQSPDEGTVKT